MGEAVIVCDVFHRFMFVNQTQSRESADGDDLKDNSKTQSSIRHHQKRVKPKFSQPMSKLIFQICVCTPRAAKCSKNIDSLSSLYNNSLLTLLFENMCECVTGLHV